MTKLFGNDRLKWLTTTQPSARMIGKCLLPIDGWQISRGYPNKEARYGKRANTVQLQAETAIGKLIKKSYVNDLSKFSIKFTCVIYVDMA